LFQGSGDFFFFPRTRSFFFAIPSWVAWIVSDVLDKTSLHYHHATTTPGLPSLHPICLSMLLFYEGLTSHLFHLERGLGEVQAIGILSTNPGLHAFVFLSQVLDPRFPRPPNVLSFFFSCRVYFISRSDVSLAAFFTLRYKKTPSFRL